MYMSCAVYTSPLPGAPNEKVQPQEKQSLLFCSPRLPSRSVCVWSHFQPIVDRSSLWSAEQGKYNSPYPRTCLVDLAVSYTHLTLPTILLV